MPLFRFSLARIATPMLAIGALTLTLTALSPSASQAQAYNCAKARLKVEHLICQNYHLGELDVQMASLYYSVLNRLGHHQKKQLKHDQKHWLKYRNSCGYSAACVEQAYYTRINELQQWAHVTQY